MSDLQMAAAHDRVVRALQAAGPAVPARLHARIGALATRRQARDRRMRLAGALSVATAVALVAALQLSPADTNAQLARMAERPASASAPAEDVRRPELLQRRFEGVDYPAWNVRFGWAASGARSDQVAGRRTDTVFYVHTHHRIAYTIVSGPPLDVPANAITARIGGLELHRFRDGRLDVVMFERGGHTCVLSGDVHDPHTLLKLAAWAGDDGEVRF